MIGDWLLLMLLTAINWPGILSERSASATYYPLADSDFLKLLQPEENKPEQLLPPTSAGLLWMTDRTLFAPEPLVPRFEVGEMGDVFDRRLGGLRVDGFSLPNSKGFLNDPDLLRFNGDLSQELYRRTVKIEVPNPEVSTLPFAGRRWKSEDRFQIPVPIALPIAEQMFVYGQFGGNGDTYNNRTTTISGKTGVGMKWSPLGGTEFQLRYGTLLNYADVYAPTRFQERAQPAVELVAKLPLLGAWQLEYTGAALPALQATTHDQIKQELKFAVPLGGGDNQFEIGARYRWDIVSTPTQTQLQTPWIDRAQLFMGVKFRR